MSYKVISTFCGPGGSSNGYKKAGLNVVTSLDYAPTGFSNKIIQTYKTNHPDTKLLVRDANEVEPEDLLEASNLEKGELDILDGSPPCSPFSNAQNENAWGSHKSGTLFDRYVYWINELQPKTFIAENVCGLAEGKNKGYFNLLLENMRKAGYKVNVQKIQSQYLGSGHRRKRLIFMGVRKDLKLEPPTIKPKCKPRKVKESLKLAENTEKDLEEAKQVLENSEMKHLLRKTGQGQRLADIKENYGYTHWRLAYNEVAPTLTSQSYILHPEEDRVITIPEVKALIGLPQDYKLEGSYSQKWECAIRCLPPELVKTLGQEMKAQVLEKT